MKINGNYWLVQNCACFLPNIILFKLKKSRKLPALCKQLVQWKMHGSAWISEPPHVDLGRPNRFVLGRLVTIPCCLYFQPSWLVCAAFVDDPAAPPLEKALSFRNKSHSMYFKSKVIELVEVHGLVA